MAVQSSFYLVDGSTRTFPSTKHIATKQHCAIYLKDKVSLLWSVASVETYTLINNSIVFDIAPASATYSDIEIRVADTQDELVDLPSDIAIVASNIADVQSLAANIDDINSIGDNLDALLVIPANLSSITSVASNVTNINLVANNIAAVDIVSNHVENIDSVSTTIVPNIVEILLADDNASIATAQAVIATSMANTVTSIYDQFDDRYLGSKLTAPVLDNDGNALLIGALYFDTAVNLMKVYGSSGWVSAGSSVNGTTERHTYTATAGQTSFTANYESGYVDVFLNGSKLQTGVDFTATSGTAIVLTSSANVGDIIDIIAYGVFEVANTTPKGNEVYTVSTVDDLVSVPSSYTTAIVKDLDRGGTFIWSATSTANGGTVFAGATGFWNRQYSGAVNVKWFGAVGDGVTDDTVAIQSALNYAGVQYNGKVEVPSGSSFLFSSTLTVPSGVILSGNGSKRGTGGLKSNVIGDISINIANGYYQAINDLNIYHATPLSSGTCIELQDNDGSGVGTDPSQHFDMANVRIIGHATGIRISSESTWCSFTNVIVESCSEAAYSLTNANLTTFTNCISDNCKSGWYLEGTTKTVLNDCTAQACTSTILAAVNILNSDNVTINNLWCERNGFHNVHIRGASRLTRINEMLNQGAGFSGTSGRGIFVDGTSSGTIIDGGWHGGNLTEDITIAATTTGTIVTNPRSTTTLTITDSSNLAMIYQRGAVRFPSTQNNSSNVNTLDDYKEGTFSPTISGTTVVGVGTYNNQVGRYTKIGRVVHFIARVNISAHTGSGNMILGNLPYASENITGLRVPVSIGELSGLTLPTNSDVNGYILENTNYVTITSRSTSGGVVSDIALALDTSFIMAISGTYITVT